MFTRELHSSPKTTTRMSIPNDIDCETVSAGNCKIKIIDKLKELANSDKFENCKDFKAAYNQYLECSKKKKKINVLNQLNQIFLIFK